MKVLNVMAQIWIIVQAATQQTHIEMIIMPLQKNAHANPIIMILEV